jgi:hypothetical protein
MKTHLKNTRSGGQRKLPPACSVILGVLCTGFFTQARAENVDSEMVLLVDVTRPGLSNTQFGQLMDGYASAFTSTEILDSIQSGAYGRIAVSMMFYGNSTTQQVGIPWMMIENMTHAEQFAAMARNLSMPFVVGTADVASALTAATFSFGTETGGASNGFESTAQIIEVATARRPQNNSAAAASASSSGALASGVDLINSLALGNQAAAIDNFYAANVIGSTIEGVAPTSTTSPINGLLASTMNGMLGESLQTGATASITAVPEPGTLLGLIPATLLLLKRRRR